MSTLPFLLSVADELDNINSQSYMDDFGLGFHPHRQYYRTPTIQLSLPASTDWMQQERQQRYRSHKFYDETQNNFQTTGEDEEYNGAEPSTSGACSSSSRQKYASALNSNRFDHTDITKTTTTTSRTGANKGLTSNAAVIKAGNDGIADNDHNTVAAAAAANASASAANDDNDDDDDDDNIDNSVRMYNLSKKCCKNYHRHAIETNVKDMSGHMAGVGVGGASGTSGGGATATGYRLHSKCMEGNNSSSDESLQKVSSSIEFLTCFLLKRSRASSSSSSSKNATGSGGPGSSGKKS